MRGGPAPYDYFALQIGVREEGFPTNAQVEGEALADFERVVEVEVDELEAGVLEFSRALHKFTPPSDQEVGYVVPCVAGAVGEHEASLRAEVVHNVAASVVILSAERDIVPADGPTRGVS